MTNEERDLITRFIERVAGAQAPAQPGAAAGAVAPLPAVDPEADRLIADLFNRYPNARYRITQMAFVQEHALVEAQNRISHLQWEVQQARQAQAQGGAQPNAAWGAGAAAAPPQQSRGFFSNLFGGGQQQAPQQQQYAQPQYAPPPPQYPQGYNPGLFQQQGSGFFGSALRTAAGVAGGVLAADALMGLFSSGRGEGGLGGGFGGGGLFGGSAQAAEYVPGGESGANPWGGGGTDPYDAGGAPKDEGSDKFSGPADVDQSAWSPAPDQGGGGGDWRQADNSSSGGWTDAPADNSGGWDRASNDSGGGWSDDSSSSSGNDDYA